MERILFTSTFRHCNVDKHRVDIMSTSWASFLFRLSASSTMQYWLTLSGYRDYIVTLYHVSKSILSISQYWPTYRIDIVSKRESSFLFTSSILQCWSTSSRLPVYIILLLSCFVNDIVDESKSTDIKSTLCLHHRSC